MCEQVGLIVLSFGLFSFCWFSSFSVDVMTFKNLVIVYFVTLGYLLGCSFVMRGREGMDLHGRGDRKEWEE